MTQKNNPEGRSFLRKLIIAVCIVVVVGALLAGAISLYNSNFVSAERVYKIENVFVDINGDGLQDYVRYAEVVINKGDFTVSP
jgi:hypothetical protein